MKKQVVANLQQLQQQPNLKKLNKSQSKQIKGGDDGIVEEEILGN